MIIMYERIICYSNGCLSVKNHIIKLWHQSQSVGYETSNSEHKRKHFDTQEKQSQSVSYIIKFIKFLSVSFKFCLPFLSTKGKHNLIYLLNFDCIRHFVWNKEMSNLCVWVVVILCDYSEKFLENKRGLY